MHGLILAGLMGLGGLLTLVSTIWLLVLGFKEHVLWGVAIFFVPGAGLVYGVMRWGKAQEALILGVVGAMMMLAAAILSLLAPAGLM
jgi:hypothetical protein